MAEKPTFLLRLDPGVLAAVKRSAAADLRSVNGQMEVLLREALRRRGIGIQEPKDRPDPSSEGELPEG